MTVIIYYEKENNIFTLEELKNYLISNMCNEYQCFVYSDKNVLLKKIQTEGQYLLFLPVVSENCSGFEIAENVVKNDINAEIIFISQMDNLVFKALGYFPFYFIRKRMMNIELKIVLERYVHQQSLKRIYGSVFQYKINGNIFQINSNDIIYLMYYKHKIILVLLDNTKIEFRGRIRDCEEQLQNKNFFKANAGMIVNFRHCYSLEQGIFTMSNGDKIAVSRNRKKLQKMNFLCIGNN